MQHRVARPRHRSGRRGRDDRFGAPWAFRWVGRLRCHASHRGDSGASHRRDPPDDPGSDHTSDAPHRYIPRLLAEWQRPASARAGRAWRPGAGRRSARRRRNPCRCRGAWRRLLHGVGTEVAPRARRDWALYVAPEQLENCRVTFPSYFSWDLPDYELRNGAVRFEGSWIPAAYIAGLRASLAFAAEAGDDRYMCARKAAERCRALLCEHGADVVTEPDQATLVSWRAHD